MNNNNYKKYLPIGTIVNLKSDKKNLMISGFCIISQDDNKMYDYIACLYPEGMLDPNKSIVFDHHEIENVHFLGYINDEEKKFKTELQENLNKYYQQDNIETIDFQ